MLTDLNSTLKQLLLQRIPLDPDEVEISFECPKREWSAKVLKPTINLYLFDLREDTDLRTGAWHEYGGNNPRPGLRRTPVYIQLSYFITAWAREVVDEHVLLWRVMTTLLREGKFGADVLQGAMKDLGPPVRTSTAQADGVLRNPGEFWAALDNDLKPAVVFAATLTVDLDVTVPAPLVLTRIVNVRDTNVDGRLREVAIGGTILKRPRGKDRSRLPVAGARVAFPQLGISVQSGEGGRFVVSNMPEGKHRVRVTTSDDAIEGEIVVPAPSYELEV